MLIEDATVIYQKLKVQCNKEGVHFFHFQKIPFVTSMWLRRSKFSRKCSHRKSLESSLCVHWLKVEKNGQEPSSLGLTQSFPVVISMELELVWGLKEFQGLIKIKNFEESIFHGILKWTTFAYFTLCPFCIIHIVLFSMYYISIVFIILFTLTFFCIIVLFHANASLFGLDDIFLWTGRIELKADS